MCTAVGVLCGPSRPGLLPVRSQPLGPLVKSRFGVLALGLGLRVWGLG